MGDSLTQGFMSGAAAQTEHSWSSWVARALSIDFTTDWHIAHWPVGGMPVNLEDIARSLETIPRRPSGLDLPTVLREAARTLDAAEDCYERGPGRPGQPVRDMLGRPLDYVTNVASFGFEIADAWGLTASNCRSFITDGDRAGDDGLFTMPSEPFHRSAARVLNPSGRPEFDHLSQVGWLTHHARTRGVKRVIVWLGANNLLRAATDLRIVRTPGTRARPRPCDLAREERRRAGWTLWHPHDFADEYAVLLDHLERAMTGNRCHDWRVYLCTVPSPLDMPLLRPFGTARRINGAWFHEGYTWHPFGRSFAAAGHGALHRGDALLLHHTVQDANAALRDLVAEKGRRWTVIDLGRTLDQAAWHLTNGRPKVRWPVEVLDLLGDRRPDTRAFHADRHGRLRRGGLFSLDGVHPSVLGHGLIAAHVLKALQDHKDAPTTARIPWAEVIAADTLLSNPPRLLGAIRSYRRLAELVVGVGRRFA